MAEKEPKEPHIVRWREIVAFPDWNVNGIDAKIDTGDSHIAASLNPSRKRLR